MGGNTIVNIIKCIDSDITIDNFVLITNNKVDTLRKFLSKNNLYFEYEKTIREHDYYYQLIQVTKNKTKNSLVAKTTKDYYFGVYNLKHRSLSFNKMLRQRLKFIQNNSKLIKYNKNIEHEMRLINGYFKKSV